MRIANESDHTFFHIANLPEDLYSHKDLVALCNLLHKFYFKTPISLLKPVDEKMSSLFTNKDIDRYTIPFAVDYYFSKHTTKPFSLTIFDTPWFTSILKQADSELYGRSRIDGFHFARFYYYFFVLYGKNPEVALKYDRLLDAYEDCFNSGEFELMMKYRERMEKIFDKYGH